MTFASDSNWVKCSKITARLPLELCDKMSSLLLSNNQFQIKNSLKVSSILRTFHKKQRIVKEAIKVHAIGARLT